MAEPRGMAEGSGAKSVARIDRRAVIQQIGRQGDTICVRGREQGQGYFNCTDLRFRGLKLAAQLLAPLGISGESGRRYRAQYGDPDRAKNYATPIQEVPP